MNDILNALRAGLRVDAAWEELLAMADYDEAAMRTAYLARDFAELGRLTAWALDQRLADEAFWLAEEEQEAAAKADYMALMALAEHAEEGPPDLMAMFKSLRPLNPICQTNEE